MNLIHNAIIRSLNAIYLQAPVVLPSNAPSFLRYCKTWSDFLHSHHLAEETHYFPYIATATGSSIVMDIHIEQHKAVEAGLRQFDKYISSLEKFSSIELRRVIDSFAPILTDHLENEIKTLVNLRIFVDVPGFDILSIEAQATKLSGSIYGPDTVPFVLTAADAAFENGLNADWPLVPHIESMFADEQWKWAPCTMHKQLKELNVG
jgi:hypothetical protein